MERRFPGLAGGSSIVTSSVRARLTKAGFMGVLWGVGDDGRDGVGEIKPAKTSISEGVGETEGVRAMIWWWASGVGW